MVDDVANLARSSAQMIFRGLRAKVGIYYGHVYHISPHADTGRADYWGDIVNRAARTMAAAQPGQVLCNASALEVRRKRSSPRLHAWLAKMRIRT